MPREKAQASAVHLVELPEPGPVEYAGDVHTTEFSAPLDGDVFATNLTGENR